MTSQQNWKSKLFQQVLFTSLKIKRHIYFCYQEKQFTAKKMMQLAESFFVSIGLEKMTPIFWAKSMLERPSWPVQCHASAEDFFRKGDFR